MSSSSVTTNAVQFHAAPEETLVDLLRRRAFEQPERQAYTFLTGGEGAAQTLSFGELDRRARAIAELLLSVGARGERVLLLYPAGLDYISGFLGCLYAGAVAVPVTPPRFNGRTERLQAVAADSEAHLVLTTKALLSKVEALWENAPALKSLRWVATDNVRLAYADDFRAPAIGGETLAFLQYTSGSTTRPRGVMVSHANLMQNERLIQKAFRQTEESVILSWLPLYHDMGLIGGVLQPLYLGARCILMSPFAFLQRPLEWLRAISDFRVTTSGGPDFAYALCARKAAQEDCSGIDLSSWEVAFDGSEPVRAETLDLFCEAFAPYGFRRESFFPCYGLAEATLLVSGSRAAPRPLVKTFSGEALKQNRVADAAPAGGPALVASGRVGAGQEVVVVDPETLTPCRADEVGEVWVSGPCVAEGYYNRPAETAETFRAHLADTGRGPFLRTGDLGFINDGELFVTGRLKELIIVRGQNYYPHDIEATVRRSAEGLRAGSGAAFSVDSGGEERLVIVQELERHCRQDPHEILGLIRQAVGEEHQLAPSAVLLLKAGGVPKTSSGKIQRRACRSLFLEGRLDAVAQWAESPSSQPEQRPASLGDAAPRSAEELRDALARWLAAKLRVEPRTIDPSRPVSAYGLDSLAAIELAHEVETGLGVSVPLHTFFESPSIDGLARSIFERLGGSASGDETPRVGAEEATEFPLSRGQQALYFLQQLAPDSPAFNIAALGAIRGALDTGALRSAFQKLIERHPLLRASFVQTPDGPLQKIGEGAEVSFRVVDAEGWAGEVLNERIVEDANRGFDLERGRLLRVTLYERRGEPLLLVVVHHIVSDFWSMGLIFKELGALYAAEASGNGEPLPALKARYDEYVRRQDEMLAGQRGERLWNYWQEKLAGELPPLELRTDRPRPAVQTHTGDSLRFALGAEATAGLKRLSVECDATLFTTLTAAFMALLHRYTGQRELLLGTVTSGRDSARFSDLVGYFVNPLVLKGEFPDRQSFRSLLSQVRSTVLGAFEHQDYPFPLLVEKLPHAHDASRPPVVQAMLVYHTATLSGQEGLTLSAVGEAGATLKAGGLEIETLPLNQRTTQFELMLRLAAVGDDIRGSLEYNTDLFDASTAARMVGHFQTLVAAALADPERPVADLPLLTGEERGQIKVWNETRKCYGEDRCVHELFEAQVERTPESVALVFEDESLTYRELNARANRLAHHLKARGIGPEARVALFAERSVEMVTGLLAILKAGGVYVPVDPSYPTERISYMLDDAGVAALLTQRHLADRIPSPRPAVVIALDADWRAVAAESDENPPHELTPENAAYVIYTSGSTGRPKGAINTHAALRNRLLWMQHAYQLTPSDRVLQKTPFSFDVSVWEFFWPLIIGAPLVLARPGGHQDSRYLVGLIREREITTLHFVPSMLGVFLEEQGVEECRSLRRVICSGEALTPTLVSRFFERSGAELHNLYGPTEAAIDVSFWQCERGNPRHTVPIGRPIANTQIHLLDERLRPVPVGVAGELYIAGGGLARGYQNRPDLTAEKFIPDPFSRAPGARMYRSGDLARYLPDGEIDFLGRADHQVKLRGQRIELGEIEGALDQHESVIQSAVTMQGDAHGGQRLVAYFTSELGRTLTLQEVREFLKGRVPEYMIPSALVRLDSMPLTPSGKIYRKALPAVPPERAEGGARFDPPRNAVERMLAGMWADVLGVEEVGIHDDFFESGGHSLLAARLVSRLNQTFQFDLPLRAFFEERTVAGLAAALTGDAERGGRAERIAELFVNVANYSEAEAETLLAENC